MDCKSIIKMVILFPLVFIAVVGFAIGGMIGAELYDNGLVGFLVGASIGAVVQYLVGFFLWLGQRYGVI